MAACYLHGSIALDAFDPQLSDIDFITLGSRACTPDDIASLRTIHQAIAQQYPQWLLEGSYLQSQDVGQLGSSRTPAPYHHDNTFHASGTFDANAVTWWVLKHQGIALRGPAPEALDFDVSWDALIAEMTQNLNSYWASWTKSPAQIARLLTDDGIHWAVLGVLRQFSSFREHAITSKTGAGVYALTQLPARWQRIVQEALNLRQRTGASMYRSRILRAREAVSFLKYIIHECNAALV
ncbi:MAG: aminoglycoside adenylyltransferase domain-containing protein [Roseiflexaceae bacterium]